MAGGLPSGSCIFTCSISCGAISSSDLPIALPILRRLSMSMALPLQKVPLVASSGFPLFHPYARRTSKGHQVGHDSAFSFEYYAQIAFYEQQLFPATSLLFLLLFL